MTYFTTEYRDQSKKHNLEKSKTARKIHTFYDKVTVAGKARYLVDPNKKREKIVAPEELKDYFIDDKILAHGWKDIKINPELIRQDGLTLSERQEEKDAKLNQNIMTQ